MSITLWCLFISLITGCLNIKLTYFRAKGETAATFGVFKDGSYVGRCVMSCNLHNAETCEFPGGVIFYNDFLSNSTLQILEYREHKYQRYLRWIGEPNVKILTQALEQTFYDMSWFCGLDSPVNGTRAPPVIQSYLLPKTKTPFLPHTE
ncbi:hypothetical protein DSO57_1034078 [Entomophthora muscae]|uniref:Uncharacterized protein n=1 Tax=Entomophthora muscae TaxID=34485 RepID=A0ACC2UKM2_9FUNG|nr:hypothetical protein DSO57_1034078 [Entomophthora muscae]